MAQFALALLLLGLFSNGVLSVNDRLREVFNWRQVDFVFPDQQTRQQAINNREFIQANNMPLGLEVWRNRLFITVPRWKAGVASTLNYINLDSSNRNRSPPLIPYPSYEMNRLPTRYERPVDHIINTFRLSVDKCDRLWAIDMGASNGTIVGEPQLFIFDLNRDRTVRQFTISSRLRRTDGSTWFPGLIVDSEPGECDRSFAYLPDIGWGMVVYSFQSNEAWRIEHNYFYFDPLSTVFNMGGVRVEWTDGVFGLGLSERHSDGYRTLYFQALASTRIFSVNTRLLQANVSMTSEIFDQYVHHGHRPAGMQAASMSMDEVSGAIFFALINQDAIGCWNPRRFQRHSIGNSAIVAQDRTTLFFPADLKVDLQSNFWVLSDRMPVFRFQVNRFDVNDVNYRVFTAPVSELIRGTVCESNGGFNGNFNNINGNAGSVNFNDNINFNSQNENFNNNDNINFNNGLGINPSRPPRPSTPNFNRGENANGWSTPNRNK
ncbi:protein yellow isoform X1 [Daktulosphaira vitifoliae]|uniref:protein yellow isoform X1 n=1 Tax=Daktulosphaira vitifoliae TaxID=58002 RepID=UPI0021AAA816|nr:protein yellow isoform X1 [Daktulosphaira vitifoliae]